MNSATLIALINAFELTVLVCMNPLIGPGWSLCLCKWEGKQTGLQNMLLLKCKCYIISIPCVMKSTANSHTEPFTSILKSQATF